MAEAEGKNGEQSQAWLHACDPSSWEAEPEGEQAGGQAGQFREPLTSPTLYYLKRTDSEEVRIRTSMYMLQGLLVMVQISNVSPEFHVCGK